MEDIKGGITAPGGFQASGVSCGIKKRGRDLALIFSDRPASAAGCLTTNQVKAACVDWTAGVLRHGSARAIVANSGNANCCTGRRGKRDCAQMAGQAARRLKIPAGEVLVASTGVIGQALPMPKVRDGIQQAAASLSSRGSLLAADAILTTDTRPKEIAVRFRIEKKMVTVGGIAKGAGMLAPNMATMLAFLTTDAAVKPQTLRKALKAWVPVTFNAVTVDGEMSTNDMVLALANGASGTPSLEPDTPSFRWFQEAIGIVCRYLAQELVRDGEGVTRTFWIKVHGAGDADAAEQVARRVANSPLVRTMVAGRDPNWGRVAAAAGAAGIPIQLNRISIRLGQTVVFRRGEPTRVPREKLLNEVDKPEFEIGIELGRGPGRAEIFSGDLTEGYVRINAKYTS